MKNTIIILFAFLLGMYLLMKFVFKKVDKNVVLQTSQLCTPLIKNEYATEYKFNTKGVCVITKCTNNFKPNEDGTDCQKSKENNCTPENPVNNATEYTLNNKNECKVSKCIKYLKPNEDNTKCIVDPVSGNFLSEIQNNLLENANGRVFVTKEEIEGADINMIANGFLNNCLSEDWKTCAKDFIEYCDDNPVDTTNPVTGLDCDHIVDDRIGEECSGYTCRNILKKCKDSSCVYIPETNSTEECSQAGVKCTPIQQKCTETPTLEDDKKYCF
jgi:hypothetical protein